MNPHFNLLIQPINMISSFIVFLTGLNLALILAVLTLSLHEIKGQFNRIRKVVWILLLIIILFGASLRIITPQHHMMFIDEYWTMEASKNILLNGRAELCEYMTYEQVVCVPYHKLTGTPFIFSLGFFFFGINTYSAIYLNIFLGSLSILLMFLLSYILLNREDSALYASLLFATYPLYIMWSGSASTNIPGILFFLFTLVSFLVYLKTRTYKIYLLTALFLTYTIQIRIELLGLLPLILIIYIIHDKHTKERIRKSRLWNIKATSFIIFVGIISRKFIPIATLFLMAFLFHDKKIRGRISKGKLWSVWIVFLLFFIPFSLQIMNYYKIIYTNSEFALFVLYQTTLTNISRYIYGIITGVYFTPPLIILSFIGILLLRKRNRKTLLIAMSIFFIFSYWFILFNLFSSAEKILLFSYLGLILLASSGAALLTDFLKKKIRKELYFSVITILLLALFFPYLYPYYNNLDMEKYNLDAKILETQIPEKIRDSISRECYIITVYPSVLSTTCLKTISTHTVLENPEAVRNIYNKTECIILYEDMGCFLNKSAENRGRVFPNNIYSSDYFIQETPTTECETIKERYNAKTFIEYALGNLTYTFYNLSISSNQS